MKKLVLLLLLLSVSSQVNAQVFFTTGVDTKLTDLFAPDELITINVIPAQGGGSTVVTPVNSKAMIGWSIQASDLAQATSYQYKLYIDGIASVLQHTCGDVNPFICVAPLPAMTVGIHELNMTASDNSVPETPAESDHSVGISIRFYIAPNVPTALKITFK